MADPLMQTFQSWGAANSKTVQPTKSASSAQPSQPTQPTPAPTQNWNGQQIPASIATKNLIAYDPKTGNKTFTLGNASKGVYTEDKNGNLVNSGHTTYGGVPAKPGFERADTVPVSMGGDNSNPANIQYEPELPKNQQAPGKLTQSDANLQKVNAQVKSGQLQPKAGLSSQLGEQNANNFPNTQAPSLGQKLKGILGDIGTGISGTVKSVTSPLVQGAKNAVQVGKNIGSDYYNSAQDMENNISQAGQGKKSLGSMTLQNASDVVNAVYAPISEPLKPLVANTFNALNAVIDKTQGKPIGTTAQRNQNDENGLMKTLAEYSKTNPDTIKNIQSGINVVMGLIGEKGADIEGANPDLSKANLNPDIGSKVDTTGQTEAPSSSPEPQAKEQELGQKVNEANKAYVEKPTAANRQNLESLRSQYKTEVSNRIGAETKPGPKSLKDVTPNYNERTMSASDKITNAEGKTQYRLNPPKTGGDTTVNSNASEFANAREVDNVKDYPQGKGKFTAKAQAVDTAAGNEAESMRGNLRAEDKVNPLDSETEKAKMQKSTYDALPEDMKAKVDAGKPLPNTKAGQYYQTTLDNANSYDGTREGKLNVRQSNDTAYQSARGKYAFGDNDLNALDDSNGKLRGDLNKDLNDTTKNSDVKSSLKKQSKLYSARDVLNDKAKTEATFKGRHPLISKLGTREVMSATTGALAGGLLGGSFTTAGKNAVNAVKGEVNKLRGISPTVKAVKSKAPPKRTIK